MARAEFDPEQFGIPAEALLSQLPEGMVGAATARLNLNGSTVGLAFVAFRVWRENRRRIRGESYVMPETMVRWTPPRDGFAFEDGVGDDPQVPLRSGFLRWRGVDYELEWVTGDEKIQLYLQYFA